MDVDTDVPATSTSNTNGVVPLYYPPYTHVVPVTPSFVIPETQDTYDPSHDYFDVRSNPQ